MDVDIGEPWGQWISHSLLEGHPLGHFIMFPCTKGTPIGHCIMQSPLKGHALGHFVMFPHTQGKPVGQCITYSPVEGQPRGLFTMSLSFFFFLNHISFPFKGHPLGHFNTFYLSEQHLCSDLLAVLYYMFFSLLLPSLVIYSIHSPFHRPSL